MHKSTIVLLGVLVALVFGISGYYLGLKTGIDKKTSATATASATATSTAVASVSPKASATADETANWKTYTNDKYGFSFKYPNTWTITNDKPGQTGFVDQNLTIKGDGSEEFQLWINPDGFGLEGASDIYTAKIQNGKFIVTSKEKREPNSDFPELTPQVAIGTVDDQTNNSYTLAYSFAMPDRTAELAKFDQILSTFKFTK